MIALGFREFVCFGADFGTTDMSSFRSQMALGDSPRNFSEAMESNMNGTVFTEPGLVLSRDSFEHTLRLYGDVVVNRVGEGLNMKFANTFTQDQLQVYCKSLKLKSTYLSDLFKKLPNLGSSNINIGKFLESLRISLSEVPEKYFSVDKLSQQLSVSHEWSASLAKHFSPILKLPSIENHDIDMLVLRILRQYIFICTHVLYDFEGSEEESRLLLQNISSLFSLRLRSYLKSC